MLTLRQRKIIDRRDYKKLTFTAEFEIMPCRLFFILKRTVADKDYFAPGLLHMAADCLFSLRYECGDHYATVCGIVNAVLQFLIENGIIIITMHYERIFEWISKMKEISVSLHFSAFDKNISFLAEKFRTALSDCKTIWILLHVCNHIFQTPVAKDNPVVEIGEKDFCSCIIDSFTPFVCYTGFKAPYVIADRFFQLIQHLDNNMDVIGHDDIAYHLDILIMQGNLPNSIFNDFANWKKFYGYSIRCDAIYPQFRKWWG